MQRTAQERIIECTVKGSRIITVDVWSLMDKEKQVPESIRRAELDFHFVPEMTKEEVLTYAPLTLAFLGDAVYELAIRTNLVQEAERSPNMLNRLSSALAKAGAQSIAMEAIEPVLTEEELSVYRRGRNAKSHTMAKNATVIDDRRATGFEALIGYLYLTGQKERYLELIRIGVEKNEQG